MSLREESWWAPCSWRRSRTWRYQAAPKAEGKSQGGTSDRRTVRFFRFLGWRWPFQSTEARSRPLTAHKLCYQQRASWNSYPNSFEKSL